MFRVFFFIINAYYSLLLRYWKWLNACMNVKCRPEVSLLERERLELISISHRVCQSWRDQFELFFSLFICWCLEGEMEVSKDGKTLSKLGPGRVFGELAILYNCERTASVKGQLRWKFISWQRDQFWKINVRWLLIAITNAKLWVLDRGIYQLITQRLGLQRHETLMQFLHQVPLLRGLPEERVSKIADTLEQVEKKGEKTNNGRSWLHSSKCSL